MVIEQQTGVADFSYYCMNSTYTLKQLFHTGQDLPATPSEAMLLLQVGQRHLAYAITDISGEKLYKLGYYATDPFELNPVSTLINEHPELSSRFYKVLVSYDYPQSSLVPSSQYSQDDNAVLLKSLFGVNGNSAIVSEQLGAWQVYNVYAVPRELHEWVRNKFSTAKYWHNYSLGVRQLQPASSSGHLLLDFRAEDFTLMAASGNALLLAQTFDYITPEDVLYYLLKVCQQFGLSQQEVHLSVAGLVDKQSALYKELYQYFVNIEFREAGWETEYPAHFFTSLNDLAKCAS